MRLTLQIITSLVVAFYSNYTAAQADLECYQKDPKGRYREHNLDLYKMHLDVRFDVMKKEVYGKVLYHFKPLQDKVDTVFLDAIEMQVHKIVGTNGEAMKYKSDSAGITIFFDAKSALKNDFSNHFEIQYTARPQKGLYFIGWDDTFNLSQKQIWSQGQGIDNRHWIPSYDDGNDKLITGLTVHFDSTYQVISNGLMTKKINDPVNKKMKIWTYEMTFPHASYLVMLGIGKYKSKEMVSGKAGGNQVKNIQYYYPEREASFNSTYQYSNEMMDWMQKELNTNYHWNKVYRNVPVQDFMFGAMENTMATVFTDLYHQDPRSALERNYIGVNAHELTHQWFGDLVTEWSGTHHWLHESFATHYSKHFIKHQLGEYEFEKSRWDEMNGAIEADKANDLPIAHTEAGSQRHYPKGSIVLDMMRYVLGNEQYRKAITYYLSKHQLKNVDSHDLYISIMESLGINLDWFFNEWVYRGGSPKMKIQYTQSPNKKETMVRIEQTHNKSGEIKNFTMPIEIEVHYQDGTRDSITGWMKGDVDTFFIKSQNPMDVSFVLVDGRNQILKRAQFDRSMASLKNQSISSPYFISRFEAIYAMRDSSIESKKDALLKAFDREEFLYSKLNIINQLAKDSADADIEKFMLKAIKDKHHQVRREVLQNYGVKRASFKSSLIEVLKDTSYFNIKTALEILCKTDSNSFRTYTDMTRPLLGFNRNIEITRHKILAREMKKINDQNYIKHLDSLIFIASKSFEFRTRVNAIEAIDELGELKASFLPVLFDGCVSFNGRLNGPAKATLKNFMSKANYTGLIEDYYKNNAWDKYQRAKLIDAFEKPKK